MYQNGPQETTKNTDNWVAQQGAVGSPLASEVSVTVVAPRAERRTSAVRDQDVNMELIEERAFGNPAPALSTAAASRRRNPRTRSTVAMTDKDVARHGTNTAAGSDFAPVTVHDAAQV